LTANATSVCGGEYQVVSMRSSWGLFSILFALVAILGRPILKQVLVRSFGWMPMNPWSWPLAIASLSFGASVLGLACGLLGLRRGRGLARFGVIANGTVLALLALMVLSFAYYRWR